MAQREVRFSDRVRITKGFYAGHECGVHGYSSWDNKFLSDGPKAFWFKADECEILKPQSFWDILLGRRAEVL